ncbi:MAG: hypothetical protein AAGB93_05335 [Planctomycetota bacterium]
MRKSADLEHLVEGPIERQRYRSAVSVDVGVRERPVTDRRPSTLAVRDL